VDKDGNGTVELDEFEHMVRESLGLNLQSCFCRMCVKDRTEAAENEAAELKEAARLAAEAAKADKLAAKLAAGVKADPTATVKAGARK
jgi:uncharacterized pyridoxal phosphate-containing UPF0001 family protein